MRGLIAAGPFNGPVGVNNTASDEEWFLVSMLSTSYLARKF